MIIKPTGIIQDSVVKKSLNWCTLKNLNLIKYDFIVSIIFLSLLLKIEDVLTWTILALISLTTLVLLDRKKKLKE